MAGGCAGAAKRGEAKGQCDNPIRRRGALASSSLPPSLLNKCPLSYVSGMIATGERTGDRRRQRRRRRRLRNSRNTYVGQARATQNKKFASARKESRLLSHIIQPKPSIWLGLHLPWKIVACALPFLPPSLSGISDNGL